jgi:hypothetical protein
MYRHSSVHSVRAPAYGTLTARSRLGPTRGLRSGETERSGEHGAHRVPRAPTRDGGPAPHASGSLELVGRFEHVTRVNRFPRSEHFRDSSVLSLGTSYSVCNKRPNLLLIWGAIFKPPSLMTVWRQCVAEWTISVISITICAQGTRSRSVLTEARHSIGPRPRQKRSTPPSRYMRGAH